MASSSPEPSAPGAAEAPGGAFSRVAVVGVSESDYCGVRDHAELLSAGLERAGVAHSTHWLRRRATGLGPARAEFTAWRRELARALDDERPDAVLLHYSVFAYSQRGIPVFAAPVLRTVQRSGAPVVAVLHEYAYAWELSGWRGRVWALSQRIALIDVMRRSSAAIATAEWRAHWLETRRWLPRRPVVFAPVYSNLPPPAAGAHPTGEPPLIGLFGYAFEGGSVSLVLDALARLRERGVALRLVLLGSPGPDSPAGASWRAEARARGLESLLAFSGSLPAQELSDALARCDVLLSVFKMGPSSRKGTLAGSLASGRPVVAIDGPRGWGELVASGAIVVSAPEPGALADALAGLLSDPQRRELIGAGGRRFHDERMGVGRTVEAVFEALGAARARAQRG